MTVGQSRFAHRERAEAAALHPRPGPPPAPGLRPQVLADIAFGGALGAVCRHLLTEAIPASPEGFPWGTFVVNMLGCLLIGVLTTYLLAGRAHRYVRPLAVTGYLGGFTTFSHLIDGIHALGRDGRWGLGVGYAVISVLVGWAAVWAGLSAGRLIPVRGRGSEG